MSIFLIQNNRNLYNINFRSYYMMWMRILNSCFLSSLPPKQSNNSNNQWTFDISNQSLWNVILWTGEINNLFVCQFGNFDFL